MGTNKFQARLHPLALMLPNGEAVRFDAVRADSQSGYTVVSFRYNGREEVAFAVGYDDLAEIIAVLQSALHYDMQHPEPKSPAVYSRYGPREPRDADEWASAEFERRRRAGMPSFPGKLEMGKGTTLRGFEESGPMPTPESLKKMRELLDLMGPPATMIIDKKDLPSLGAPYARPEVVIKPLKPGEVALPYKRSEERMTALEKRLNDIRNATKHKNDESGT